MLVGFLLDAHARLGAELADPIFAPFLSPALITPMLLGPALSEHANLLAIVTLAFVILCTRTLIALARGTFLPRSTPPALSPQ